MMDEFGGSRNYGVFGHYRMHGERNRLRWFLAVLKSVADAPQFLPRPVEFWSHTCICST